LDQLCERRPLGRARVGLALELLRIPDISVFGRAVEFAGQDHRARWFARRVDVLMQPLQPLQLVLVVVLVEAPTVGYVATGDAHTAACRPTDTRIGIGVTAVSEADLRVF